MSRTIVITGASDGIGAAAARALAARGEQVVLVGRSAGKTAAVAADTGAPYYLADFADLAQVRALAGKLRANHPHVDVLVNNAGGVMGERRVTVDGHEKTFQVNHLAGFLLTELLGDVLTASGATVINTASSAAANFGRIDLDDLDNTAGYSPNKAYGDAKLANILHAAELERRHGTQGRHAVSFHPGNVATNFAADTTSWFRFIYRTPIRKLALISPEKGAETLLWLIDGTPGRTWTPGEFYVDKKVAKTNPQAADTDLARRHFDRSAELLAA